MPIPAANLLHPLPAPGGNEHIDTLVERGAVRLVRIVSHGHVTSPGSWYDQADDEWVMLAAGEAELAFEDGQRLAMTPGDHVLIPAGRRHRVERTGPATVWLALHVPRGAR